GVLFCHDCLRADSDKNPANRKNRAKRMMGRKRNRGENGLEGETTDFVKEPIIPPEIKTIGKTHGVLKSK
ncbi:MAG: hypothetical protein RJB31_1376, partial [Bacteroidota bacterium]